jgi:hypothetical protein
MIRLISWLFSLSVIDLRNRNSRKMNSTNTNVPGRFSLNRSTICALAALVATIFFVQGCKQDDSESDVPDAGSEPTVIISLETTFDGLLPDEFEINVPRDLPTADINEWGEEMLSDMVDQDVDEKKLAESLAKVLPGEIVERVLRPRFVLRDSNHIRDSLWARELIESVGTHSDSEMGRVVDLFYFVVNTMPLIRAERWLPFGPFESALYGRGTAEDRAWAFASLLRQKRIPTVVLIENAPAVEEPAAAADVVSDDIPDRAAESESRSPLIVGALLNDSLYLFDAELGLPIPGPDDSGTTAMVRSPATLAQVLSDPSLLSNLGHEGSPYEITADRLKTFQPQVIGESSLWSRRMEGLQNGMPNEITASVFEPLVSHGIFEGVIEQVSAHVSKVLPDANVGVWLYPEQQRELREAVAGNKQQSELLADLNEAFKVPEPFIVSVKQNKNDPGNPKLKFTFGASWGVHRKGRIDQILGRPEKAIPAYLSVQGWREQPPMPKDTEPIAPNLMPLVMQQLPEDVRARHQAAAEEAVIWRATCQMQKRSYSSAATDLEAYVRQVPDIYAGRFRSEANYLAGISLAMSGNSRRGAAFLRNVAPETSRHDVSRWLLRRWSAQNEKAEAEKPQTEKAE